MNTTYAFCFSLRNFRELPACLWGSKRKKQLLPPRESSRRTALVSVSSSHFYALSTNSFYCTLGLILPAWMGSQECPQIIFFFLVLIKDAMRLDPDRARKQSKVKQQCSQRLSDSRTKGCRQRTHSCPGNSVIIQLCWQTAPFKLAPFN